MRVLSAVAITKTFKKCQYGDQLFYQKLLPRKRWVFHKKNEQKKKSKEPKKQGEIMKTTRKNHIDINKE